MKYAIAVAVMFMVGNEIFSLICLMAMVSFIFMDIAKGNERRGY